MTECSTTLVLRESEWLTVDVISEALNQVDDEKDTFYTPDCTLALMIQSFISLIRDMNNDRLIEYLEYYDKLFRDSHLRKVTRSINLPDSQHKWLKGRCNRMNEGSFDDAPPSFSIDLLVTTAVYEYRNKHFREESEELAMVINTHIKKPKSKLAAKQYYVSFTLFRRDIDTLRFFAECASYFYGRKLMHYEVISLALENWLVKYGRKDPLKIYNTLEEIALRLQRFRGYKVWGWKHDLDKTKLGCVIRKDVYFGISRVLSEIEAMDQCAITMSLDVIATDAIRELKKDYLLEGTISTLKLASGKRGFSPF